MPWERLSTPWGPCYQATSADLYLAHLGIGKVNTAAGLALLSAQLRPAAVVQFGIGGAFPASGLNLGSLALAQSDTHMDCGVQFTARFDDLTTVGFPLVKGFGNTFPTDNALTEALQQLCSPSLCAFGTAESITGDAQRARFLRERFAVDMESMEGAAAAQICAQLSVPFAQLRGVSNIVGERDKSKWQLQKAVQSVNDAVIAYVSTYHVS